MPAPAVHVQDPSGSPRASRTRAIAIALAGFALFMLLADSVLGLTGAAGPVANLSLGEMFGISPAAISEFSDILFGSETRLVWIAALGLSFVLALQSMETGQADAMSDEMTHHFQGIPGSQSNSGRLPEAEMARLVYTDELTEMPNRRGFDERMKHLIERHAATGKVFLVGLIDLDGFKPINDIYGIDAGDDILRQVALRLEGATRGSGFASRFGSDDFAFLAPGLSDEESAQEFGRALSDILGAPYDLENRRVRLSASIGMAMYSESSEKPDLAIERAASALYQAKRGETGKVVIYSKKLEARLNEAVRIEQALRKAISEGAIEPHFQPIVRLSDQRILGFEALARWTDPELGPVSPGLFIPIAEQRGLIGEMTEILLYNAAREARQWPGDTFLSFNLSTTQLSDPGTALKVLSILSRAGLDPGRLEVEITETALMTDTATAKSVLDELRQTGVRVALDDFGTGYSSLGYLRELQLDKVKIDRTFVADMGQERQSDHIIKAILEMCTGLDLAVVAEGIEEFHQVTGLREFGCQAGQGYYFGKPMEARNARELFHSFPERKAITIH